MNPAVTSVTFAPIAKKIAVVLSAYLVLFLGVGLHAQSVAHHRGGDSLPAGSAGWYQALSGGSTAAAPTQSRPSALAPGASALAPRSAGTRLSPPTNAMPTPPPTWLSAGAGLPRPAGNPAPASLSPRSSAPEPARPPQPAAPPGSPNGPTPPSVHIADVQPSDVRVGHEVDVYLRAGDPDGVLRVYAIDWGDGTTDYEQLPDRCPGPAADPERTLPPLKHTYNQVGSYRVKAAVFSRGTCDRGAMQTATDSRALDVGPYVPSVPAIP